MAISTIQYKKYTSYISVNEYGTSSIESFFKVDMEPRIKNKPNFKCPIYALANPYVIKREVTQVGTKVNTRNQYWTITKTIRISSIGMQLTDDNGFPTILSSVQWFL